MQKKEYQEPHTIVVDRHTIELTHCSKILFPQNYITKADLIDYYLNIAPHMLPYIANRAVTLQRFVHGITEEGFYQKDAGTYFPSWIRRQKIAKHADGTTQYVVINNAATLVYLTNQVTITYHAWLSKIDKLHIPDRIIFDLDPAGKATFKDIVAVARLLHDYCTQRGINPLVMTTGSRGLHVIIPLKRHHDFDTVRAIARNIATWCISQKPNLATLEIRLKNRGNAVYIDVLRNAYAQTGVAAYSVRAHPHAPVATPISWDELFDGIIKKSAQFTIKTIFERLVKKNVWHHQAHPVSLERLEP